MSIEVSTIFKALGLLGGAAGVYATMAVADARHDAKIEEHDKEIAQITRNIEEIQKSIHTDIKEIDRKVTEILVEQARKNNDARNPARRVQ